MILGIGCDILKRSRISYLLSRGATKQSKTSENDHSAYSKAKEQTRLWRFSRRILSVREQKEFDSIVSLSMVKSKSEPNTQALSYNDRILDFLAVRWVAKEACYKAFYPTEKLSWKNISVVKGLQSGPLKPTIKMENEQLSETYRIHLSISHDGDYVMGNVVVEK